MGFSGLMGFVGGAARAGEQVADKTLERMDAAGVAKAKEEAQLRLEQRTEQAAIAREGRANSRDDFTHKRGLMDERAKLEDSRQFAITDEQRKYDLGRARIPNIIEDSNAIYTGSEEKQEGAGKTKAEIKSLEAKAGHDNAAAKKLLSEIGAEGKKPLTHSEKMAEYKAGKELIDNAYNVTYNAFGIADPSTVKDKAGYSQSLAKLQTKIWGQEGLGTEIANNITTGARTEQDSKAAREDAYVKEQNSKLGFFDSKGSNITRNEKGDVVVPEGWQPSQAKPATPNAPKQEGKAAVLPPINTRKDGDTTEINGAKYSWNSKARDGKGGWGPVQAAPSAPTKAKGLMNEAGAATMPQADDLATKAAAAKQRMNELAKNTNYTSREERDAARKQKSAPQKPEIAPGSTPEPTSTTSSLAPVGLTATGAKVEAEYQALLNQDVPAIEFAKRLGVLLNDPEFRNNHPDMVKRYRIYQSEAADEVAGYQSKKGSR